ncbi:MAG: pyridoxamine 5'-phosphate oxidase family protein [Usitatibacteraceae bacterium]
MNAEAQSDPHLALLCKSIENATVVMLTSLDADGALLTRPLAPLEMDGEGGLWFFTDLRSAQIEHMRVANVSFADPTCGTYVSLFGRSEVCTDRARIERLWTTFANAAFPAGADSMYLALLKFVADPAENWDSTDGNMQRMFAEAPLSADKRSHDA